MLKILFKLRGAQIYYIELAADYNLRLKRNKTENRLLNKPSKRDIQQSEQLFKNLESYYRLNSYDNEIQKENYIKIDNTNLEADAVAKIIRDKFLL